MPHRCTNCERTFAGGSTEMLSGCPDCGGNRFQFLPHAEVDADELGSKPSTAPAQTALTQHRSSPSSNPSSKNSSTQSSSRSVAERARETVSGLFGGNSSEQTTLLEAANQARIELQSGQLGATEAGGGAPSDATPQFDSNDESETTPVSDSRPESRTSHRPNSDSRFESRTIDDPVESDEPLPPQSTLSTHADVPESAPVGDSESAPVGDSEFEDRAQAAARSSVVSRDELPPFPTRTVDEPPLEPTSEPVSEPTPGTSQESGPRPSTGEATDSAEDVRERPDLQQLRDELQNEFESIRIVERGQYELNLMELYERRECIIELQENGRYVIQVPESLEAKR